MSFFDDASLAFLPSGAAGKDGKAYSIKPTDGTGDFTFSRGSNLAATRVGADGLIEKGRENLFLRSNEFDTSPWASSVTLTSGQSGYDGSSDAWLLTKTASGAQSVYNYITQTGVATMSVYAKAGSVNWMRLTHGGVTAYFDLSGSGAVGATSNGIDQTITSVGNGWFRCTLTANRTAAGQTPIYPYTAEGDSSGSTDSIYIQSSQLEIGLAATDVISTGASTGKAGLLEDEPRFDYSGGATCPSLLLEPSRTNLAPYSEYIEGLALTDLTPTPNATISPEGLQNAYKVLTGTAGSEQIAAADTSTTGNVKTQSVYIKEDSGVQWIRLIQLRSGFSNSASTWFDIQNGVKGSKEQNGTTSVVDDATKIEDAGNGWYRLTLVCTDSTNNTNFDTRVRTAIANGSGTRVSNGSYFVWGYQMESDASYPTSYIPNHSGGSVTRGADDASNTNTIDSDNDFTFYFESTLIPENFGGKYFDNQSNGYLSGYNIGGSNLRHRYSGTNYGFTAPEGVFKYLIRKDSTNMKFYLNGVLEYTITTLPTGTNDLELLGGKVHKTLLFPEALSDADCITLTTL